MTDDLDLLRLHRIDPVLPSVQARAVARRSLEQAISAEIRGEPSRRRAGRFGKGLLMRGAVAALLAGATVAAVGTLRSGSATSPALAARPLLDHLARVAAAQPPAVPGPGQYLYTASSSLTGSDTVLSGGVYCQIVFREYRQNWIAANGEGLFRESDGPAHYASTHEPAACGAAAAQPAGVSNTWAAPGCLSISPVPLGRLPRDPATLRARLLTGKVEGGPPGPAEAFAQVGDLLRETNAPAALRAALYRAASGLRGVKSIGVITDKLGRKGVGLAVDGRGVRHELIFSATTSALLSEQVVLIGKAPGVHAKKGTVLSWSAYTAGRVVDRLPVPSPLPLTPACVHGGSTELPIPGHPRDGVLVGSSAAVRR